MADVVRRGRVWQVADVVAVVVGVVLLAFVVWPIPHASIITEGQQPPLLGGWFAHMFAGVLTVGGAFTAQYLRLRRVAQGMLVIAAIILLARFFTLHPIAGWTIATMALPAVVLLVTAPFIGPIPPPADEPLR